jgi:hypothetical protein
MCKFIQRQFVLLKRQTGILERDAVYIDRPAIRVQNDDQLWYSVDDFVLAHVGLARAYALSGESAKARAQYEEFFSLWNGADPDIPVLKQAKAEFGNLR